MDAFFSPESVAEFLAFANCMNAPANLPAEWKPIPPTEAERYEDEYAVEIEKGHPLYGVPVRAVALHDNTGAVLFALLRHLCDYAVVQLTWSGCPEPDPARPKFRIYVDEADLKGNRVKPDDDIPF